MKGGKRNKGGKKGGRKEGMVSYKKSHTRPSFTYEKLGNLTFAVRSDDLSQSDVKLSFNIFARSTRFSITCS